MISKIGTGRVAPPPRHEEVAKAARELEAVFVRSLLAATPLAGKGDAYGGMAVDALAQAITAGRGVGLGALIERAIEAADHREAPAPSISPVPLNFRR
jgi:Rod binding domain-containing protein